MKDLKQNYIITKINIIQTQIDNWIITKSDMLQVNRVDIIITKCMLQSNITPKLDGRRALVVKCFPRTHRKVSGSNHSGFTIHEFSFGLLVRILPSAFSLPAFMYSA